MDTSIIGQHTCVPSLLGAPSVYSNTILRQSQGLLPPYCVVVGHRHRVEKAALLLDNCTILDKAMGAAGLESGRNAIAVGTYKGTPVCFMEHQMGCAGAGEQASISLTLDSTMFSEIFFREVLSTNNMTTKFVLDKGDGTPHQVFNSDAKYVIRVGTCAGINPSLKTQEKMTAGQKLKDCIQMYDLVSPHLVFFLVFLNS